MKICKIHVEPGKAPLSVPLSLGCHYSLKTDNFSVDLFVDTINQRLKIKNYRVLDYDAFNSYLKFVACANNLSKIIMVTKEEDWQHMFKRGFCLEALHPSFFKGSPGFHLSKFLSSERRNSFQWEKEEEILEIAFNPTSKTKSLPSLPEGYEIRTAAVDDIRLLIPLYTRVFETYPVPLTDPEYLKKVIQNNTIFKLILHNGQAISAASIDVDKITLSAELTDCATLPEYSGQGLMSHLIFHLEQAGKSMNLITIFTIARAISPGINRVFARHNYTYYGRFINNCSICSGFEDMNLWSKQI